MKKMMLQFSEAHALPGSLWRAVPLGLLFAATTLYAKDKPAPVPAADYTLNLHVSSSERIASCASKPGWPCQHIFATVDGKKYELETLVVPFVFFALGDYPARLISQKPQPNGYDQNVTYELLLPDGKARQFAVVGVSE